MRTKRVLLTKTEIGKALKKCEGWSVNTKETQFYKTYTFPKYIDALIFIARVSVHAEVLHHHPDIQFSYTKVKVTISTHELGGLTKLDVALLERIHNLKT